jgi:hypothetical protein
MNHTENQDKPGVIKKVKDSVEFSVGLLVHLIGKAFGG